jgi:hypothetical protein
MALSVFISSTSQDLREYREAATEICNRLGFAPLAMEFFEAMSAGATEGSKRKLEEAELYIGIFAHRYGYIEEGYDKSVTEIEFDYATELKLPRLCFLVDPSYPWPPEFIDHENRQRLNDLKARIEKNLIRSLFTTVEDFKLKLMQALYDHVPTIRARRTTVIAAGDEVTESCITVDEIEYPRRWKRPLETGPIRWEKATGRRGELESLRARFQPDQQSASAAIAGMPGTGKSTLASMFAHQFDATYPGGVLWAQLGPKIREGDPRIQETLDRWAIYAFGGDPAVERDLVRRRYHFTPAAVRHLLSDHGLMMVVLDDVWGSAETVGELQQAVPADAHVLVTTRDTRIADSFGIMPLDVLSGEDAAELLRSKLSDMPDESLRRLADGLGYHAQALDIAASDILLRGSLERREKAIDQLLERVRTGASLGDLPQPDQEDYQNYVRIALEFSYEDIGRASRGQELQRKFRYLGSFAPPEADFDARAAGRLWEEEPNAAADFLDVLCDRSLLTQSSTTRWTQHAILRAFALSLLMREGESTDAQKRHLTYYLKQAESGQVLEADLSQIQHAFGEADHETRLRILERLIPNVPIVPGIWDTARSFVAQLIRSGQYDVLDALAQSADTTSQELLSSALIEFFPDPDHQATLHDRLAGWLAWQGDSLDRVRLIVANVAIRYAVDDVLTSILLGDHESSRERVVQDIYQLWADNRPVTRQLLITLANQVNLLNVRKRIAWLDVLFRCALIIVLQDYYHVGATSDAVAEMRAIWQPLIRRVFLVSRIPPVEAGMKRVRRGLVRLAMSYVVRMIRNLEGKGQLVFNYDDLESFFPANDRRRQVFDRLLSHLDAIIGRAPEDFDQVLAYIKQLMLVDKDEDLLTAGVTGVVYISHLHRDPVATAASLRRFAHDLAEVHDPTTDPQRPTASLWVTIIVEVFATFDYASLDPGTARTLLEAFIDISYLFEEHFWNSWRFKSGATIRLPGLDDTLFGYALGAPDLGRESLERFLHLLVARDDLDQIIRSVVAIPDSMSFFSLPDAGIDMLYDTVQLLKQYLTTLDDEQRTGFWTEFADKLVLYGSKYPEHVLAFAQRFDEGGLPAPVKRRLVGAAIQQDVGYSQLVAFSHFAIKALGDPDPFTRNLIRWGLEQALQAKNAPSWITACVIHLANLLYGQELIREVAPGVSVGNSKTPM